MPTKNIALLTAQQLMPAVNLAKRVLRELDAILLGRSELHRMVLVGIMSQGHILLEGVPGVGKTALIKTLGSLLHLEFSRVQFTPDLMPGDILGAHILQQNEQGRREMTFQPGPIFTNILLADEINRASPKTQSALLEAMQERCVTLLGETRALPKPFFVLASQNPIELEGTYPLPEAQLDRFLFKLNVAAPDANTLEAIIATRRRGEPPLPAWRLEPAELEGLFTTIDSIFLPRPVARYISNLVSCTHPGLPQAPQAVRQYVGYGASPRAAIAMAEAARGVALLAGRPTVGFEDVKEVAVAALNHRVLLNYQARFDRVEIAQVLEELLKSVSPADLNLPDDLELTVGAASHA